MFVKEPWAAASTAQGVRRSGQLALSRAREARNAPCRGQLHPGGCHAAHWSFLPRSPALTSGLETLPPGPPCSLLSPQSDPPGRTPGTEPRSPLAPGVACSPDQPSLPSLPKALTAIQPHSHSPLWGSASQDTREALCRMRTLRLQLQPHPGRAGTSSEARVPPLVLCRLHTTPCCLAALAAQEGRRL